MKVLDLFSGIGGFSLGLDRAGMQTIAFCEIEDFPRQILKKHWPEVPCAGDIKNLTYKSGVLYDDGQPIYTGSIDVICGGYPCQPFSVAGKQLGEKDDRHLWPEYLRLIREIKPRWIIGENVAGHIAMGLDAVLSDLEGESYRWEAFVIPACAINAPHRRDRIWIVANARHALRDQFQESGNNGSTSANQPEGSGPCRQSKRSSGSIGRDKNVANHDCERIKEYESRGEPSQTSGQPASLFGGLRSGGDDWGSRIREFWALEPGVGRVAHGVPRRVDRLKGLGNAVVPEIPEILGRGIMEIELASN